MTDELMDEIKAFLAREELHDFSPTAKQDALNLAIDLGKVEAQKLYHFAVLVTKLA